MKIAVLLSGIMLLASLSCNSQQTPTAKVNGFALVELFTSEGCSSCPAADALMPKLVEEYGEHIITLSFHVDYWDRLGWKDPFSQHLFTERRNRYANFLNQEFVYTPEAIVNRTKGMIGSDKSDLKQAISQVIASKENRAIQLQQSTTNDAITVSFSCELRKEDLLLVVLAKTQATTTVKKGENAGRTLKHSNVVYELRSFSSGNGNASFKVPAGLSRKDFKIVAFIQSKQTMEITGAREMNVL